MFVNEFAGAPVGSVQLKRKSEAPLVAREKVTLSVTEYMLGLTKVVTAWAEKVRVVTSRIANAGIRRGEAEDPYIRTFLVRVGDLSNGGGGGRNSSLNS
jgi:hypothetical protein